MPRARVQFAASVPVGETGGEQTGAQELQFDSKCAGSQPLEGSKKPWECVHVPAQVSSGSTNGWSLVKL